MDKSRMMEALRERVRQELQAVEEAALASHHAATHEESRSEDKHDTRSIEAGYLAGAQAQRVAELQALVAAFSRIEPKAFGPKDAIAPGALVLLENEDGKRTWHLMALQGGGFQFSFEGRPIQVVTKNSPVGDELFDRRAGDTVEVEIRGQMKELEILSVE